MRAAADAGGGERADRLPPLRQRAWPARRRHAAPRAAAPASTSTACNSRTSSTWPAASSPPSPPTRSSGGLPLDPTLSDAGQREREALLRALGPHADGWSDADRVIAAAMFNVLWRVAVYEHLAVDWGFDERRRHHRHHLGHRPDRGCRQGGPGAVAGGVTTSPSATRIFPMSPTRRSSSSSVEPDRAEEVGVELLDGLIEEAPALGGDLDVRGPSVGGMRHPAAQARLLEPVDRARHRRRRDPQSVAHGAERQWTGPPQHPEHLVASEGQAQRPKDGRRPVEEDLFGPHHRDDRRHPGCALAPPLLHPTLPRRLDRVVGQRVLHWTNLPRGVRDVADHAELAQLRQLVVGDPDGSQDLVGVLAQQAARGDGGSGRGPERDGTAWCCAGRFR